MASNNSVLILFFVLLALLALLFTLYKVLNKEANGEYTIRRVVYKEGGVRDRVRGVAIALGNRTGIQLWPHSEGQEDEEEMEEDNGEEQRLEEGSRKADSGSDEEEEEEEEEEEGKGDASSLETSEGDEQTRLVDETEEKEEKVGDGEGKGEVSGGVGMLIDLKQFSGSAIWSEQEGGERDLTAL